MKVLVKRNRLNTFEKAKIEIEEVEEWSLLQMAMKHYIDYMETHNFHNSDDEDAKKLHERAIKISNVLDKNNEIKWN